MAKKPTFSEKRDELLSYLKSVDWTVIGPSFNEMKVPHATSPDGTIRLWFKTQAIYAQVTPGHRLSFDIGESDMREYDGPHLVADATRWKSS